MKKIFTIAAIALFTITSCSDDDSTPTSNPDESAILPVKIIRTEDGEIITSDLTYNGTKLVSVINEYGSDLYTYDGDQIVERKVYEGSTLMYHEFFEYNENGQLSEYRELTIADNTANKTLFTYNSNGTISTEEYGGNLESQTELEYNGIITMENGNIVSYVNEISNYTYTYDTKNNPTKNITGIQAIYIAIQSGGVNNITSENYVVVPSGIELDWTYTYTYNSDNFPVTENVTGQSTYSDQFFYE